MAAGSNGGAIRITGAGSSATLANGSSIVRSLAYEGGTISMEAGTTLRMVNRSFIATSRAFRSGGIAVDGGSVTIEQHCTRSRPRRFLVLEPR
eukprot:4730487-Prymnesium_polylepis.1